MKILLIEDDVKIAKNLSILLGRETYAVCVAHDLDQGTSMALGDEYDLVICDRRLPGGDGTKLVEAMRESGLSTPILMLTAKSTQEDVSFGLDIGADDYLTKPFDHRVLLSRVRALLRRRKKIVESPIITQGEVKIDTNTRVVTRSNKVVILSPKEYSVLEYLMVKRGTVVERMDILTHVWDSEVDLFSNTVDVHIRYLRKKLGKSIISTVRGAGYAIWQK